MASSRQSARRYEFGPFQLNVSDRRLLRDGKAVPLTPKVFETLLVLVENSGRLVAKEDLMKALWPDAFVQEGGLMRNVSILRKTLGRDPAGRDYIETAPKLGYRFISSVTRLDDSSATTVVMEKTTVSHMVTVEDEEIVESLQLEPASQVGATLTTRAAPHQTRRWPLSLVIAGSLLGCLLIYLLSHRTSASEPAAPIKSVAVIPFKNLTGDAAQEYFSDGMTESFITQLSRVSGLKVLSRTSAFTFKGKEIDARTIGRDLGVESILEGSVRRNGERVRVEVRLVSTTDGHVIWASEDYDRALKDIFAVQDEIACNVAASLRVRLCGKAENAAGRQGAHNIDAYEAYLKGQYYLNKRTSDGISRAIDYFQQTISIDPDDAAAYSGLADCYFQSLYFTSTPSSQLIAKGKEMAGKALSIDETLGQAHALLSILSDAEWDFSEAVREARLAIGISPNSARAHHLLAFVLSKRGYFDEGLSEIRKAHELDPLNLVINNDIAELLCYAGRYDEAIEQCDQTLGLDPNFSMPYACLAVAYWGKGMYAESLHPIQKAVELDDKAPYRRVQLAMAYGFAGRRDKAQALLTKLKARAMTEDVDPLWIAGLYAAIGESNDALYWIEKACDKHSFSANGLLCDVRFATLRSEPRYKAALARLGLAP